VRGAGGNLLRSVSVFDRFTRSAGEPGSAAATGTGDRDGEVSLALHLEFAAPDRTLTDEEVGRVRERILAALAEQGVHPRG
jgi:phenylalanyl-tRNA synthetase beta subunit